MSKKSCCCGPKPETTSFCCNPIFFKEFISLYGTSMAEHAEVSPEDWIALYVPRPKMVSEQTRRWVNQQAADCKCCCQCPRTRDNGPELIDDSGGGIVINPNNFYGFNIKTNFLNKITNFFGSKSTNAYLAKKDNGLSATDPSNVVNNNLNSQEPSFVVDPVLCAQTAPCGVNVVQYCSPGSPGYQNADHPVHKCCKLGCCKGDYFESFAPGTDPMIFAYKYSGCNFIWFPREFTFGHNPYVSQCNGFLTKRLNDDGNEILSQNSCHPEFPQRPFAGSAFDSGCQPCFQEGGEEDRSYPKYPCPCVIFPHIHGGTIDSVFNRTNVKLSTGQMGYLPHMSPFSLGMTVEEAGCCWCACTAPQNWADYSKGRNTCFGQIYPFADQQGKTVSQTKPCSPGINCHHIPGTSPYVAGNPRYSRRCFEWSISPYLQRVAQKNYPCGYEIWMHGRYPSYKHDFGPYYLGLSVDPNELQKDIKIKFKKVTGVKTNLLQQYIGFVQLEHHFEMYAFRSDGGLKTIEMLPLQNHARLLILPFEKPYAGTFTNAGGGRISWKPWNYDSNMWQIRRGTPRRVMYQSSGIPIFHFDLVAMETLCEEDKSIVGPGGAFDGVKFLEHYYRYFFAMSSYYSGTCTSIGDVPGPKEWNYVHLLESKQYVQGWIELMVVHGILRIKDHAIDISKEVNKIIQTGTYETTPEGTQVIVIPDAIAKLVGGVEGYEELVNFFEVEVGQANATTPKDIKQKLLNPDGLREFIDSSSDAVFMNCFLPRKATLPLSYSINGITTWGCDGDSLQQTPYDGISCASYTVQAQELPPYYNISDPDNPASSLIPIKVFSGLGATIVMDATEKISIFGGAPEGADSVCPDFQTNQYPSSITCIPWYLSVLGNYNGLFESNKTVEQIPDGKVIDVAIKGTNAIMALVDFENGGLGYNCSNPTLGEEPENLSSDDDVPSGTQEFFEYSQTNCNGVNLVPVGQYIYCASYEPFDASQSPQGESIAGGIRSDETRPPGTYRIKSWGSDAKKATFSLAQQDTLKLPIRNRGYDPSINPNNLRYPGTNNWFIWKKVAAGVNHYCALDDYGGVFITPLSDNSYGQSDKGFPLTYSESFAQNYDGFGRGFNYYKHIPRPGFVKEEEWTLDFYRHITGIPGPQSYLFNLCACPYTLPNCNPGPDTGGPLFAENQFCAGFLIQTKNEEGECIDPIPGQEVYDKTCTLMGNLVNQRDYPFANTQPRYIDLAAGHYNTLLLSNENKLEIFGTYFQIDESGIPVGPMVTEIIDGEEVTYLKGITAFIPEPLQQIAGTWNVDYACSFHCDGATHSPIINASFNAPSYSNVIVDIESSCDYSVCVLQSNLIYVWGDVSMIPGVYNPDTYVPGTKGYNAIYLTGTDLEKITINKVSLGVNSFYISYTYLIPGTSYSINRVYSYTRYGKIDYGTNYPDYLQNKAITDLSAGYGHAVAIISEGIAAKTWDYSSFPEDVKKYQYKNWESIPPYFKRDAYFHSIQGGWDFSKWMYGSNCCTAITDVDHPIIQPDPCAALSYSLYSPLNNPNNPSNINLSYSGHPGDFWMRPDWRRITAQGFGYFGSAASQNTVNCDPDGSSVSGDGTQAMLSSYGSCIAYEGSVWSESRPSADATRRNIRTPIFPPCYPGSRAESCVLYPEYYTSGIIPDESPEWIQNGCGAALSRGVDIPPSVTYKASKDIFQMKTTRWGADSWGAASDDAPCTKHIASNISYFKYCERHYYFGYDKEEQTWDIYENPDFLHNIDPVVEYYCDQGAKDVLDPIGGCTLGITYIGPYPGSGFGGGGTGVSGYNSLVDYPMTGPNYAREDYTYIPVHVINNKFLTGSLFQAVCSLIPDDPNAATCYTCGVSLQANASTLVSYFGGPGAFYWKPLCPGGSYNFSNLSPMYRAYFYAEKYIGTLKPVDLLKGVSNNIDKEIDPKIDPNYKKVTFKQVLFDPAFTETTEHWKKGNSTKWMPMFVESGNYFPSQICGLNGDVLGYISFTGKNDTSIPDPYLQLYCLPGPDSPTQFTDFGTTPVLCDIGECCPPPE